MKPPENTNLPFFAYGLFKPGELAYFQLHEYVLKVTSPALARGNLLVRDGLPIIGPDTQGSVKGTLLTFHPDKTIAAYKRISDMEPDEHYKWQTEQIGQTSANVLFGRRPAKGSESCPPEWDGWKDPLFDEALDVVEEVHKEVSESTKRDSYKLLFKLQMAYLLLWVSIERYLSLRYRLGKNATGKVTLLAEESGFAKSLKLRVKDKRVVHRADEPGTKLVLNPSVPEEAVDYYYQVRCNVTHRGKSGASDRDYEILESSLRELLAIFKDVLKAAKEDAEKLKLEVNESRKLGQVDC